MNRNRKLIPCLTLILCIVTTQQFALAASSTKKINYWTHSIYFANKKQGFAVGSDFILSTKDGGDTWTHRDRKYQTELRSVIFNSDGKHGWSVGRNIYSTSNGGLHWVPYDVPSEVYFSAYDVHASKNGMYLWTTLSAGSPGLMRFIRDMNKYSAGNIESLEGSPKELKKKYLGRVARILRSKNSGKNWEVVNINNIEVDLYGIHFNDDNRYGWAVGQIGTIIHTTDGGATWSPQKSNLRSELNDIYFLNNAMNGWAIGLDGALLTTNNGGKRWNRMNLDLNDKYVFSSINFSPSGKTGFIVGSKGLILTTHDYGQNWSVKKVKTEGYFKSVYIHNDRYAWIAGTDGALFKTTNGGKHWKSIGFNVVNHPSYIKSKMTAAKSAFKKRNYNSALTLFKSLAHMGHAAAQYNLAIMYEKGYGTKPDMHKSTKWYRWSAENNYLDAKYRIGKFYETGNYFRKDYKLARKWYEKASIPVHGEAVYSLAKLYLNGLGGEKDIKKAALYFRQAANIGKHLESTYELASLIDKGYGAVEGVYFYSPAEQSAKLMLRAAKRGHIKAQADIGAYYLQGFGVKKDHKHAYRWTRKAAEKNDPTATNNLGFMYEKGYGVERDTRKAIKLFKKAANANDVNGQYNLAKHYEKGNLLSQDYSLAAYWYKKASEQGHTDAQNSLAVMYLEGRGVSPDYDFAAKLLIRAAKNKNASAQSNLGALYWEGKGLEKSVVKAYAWTLLSAESDESNAKNNLSVMSQNISEADKERSLELLEEYRKKYKW